MNRLRMPWKLNRFAWGALLPCLVGAVGCGEPSCPAGSISVGGRCEPVAETCGPDEVEDGGVCVADSEPASDGGDGDGSITDGESLDADAMATESPDPLCDALECGDHGACEVVDDQPICKCSDGFAGDACDSCEAGLVLEDDACVSPCEAQDAPDCGAHGSCEEKDGEAICACEHPYVGDESCAECAAGFALQPSGVCEPDCGECGAHAVCNETLMTPSCECVAGYEELAETCVWSGNGETGGIVDGDLDDPSAWTTKLVDLSGGEIEFQNANVEGVCNLGAIEQTVRLPAYEDSEPLVLEIEARTTCTQSDPRNCNALLVDIGEKVTRLSLPGGPTATNSKPIVCLTEGDYRDQIVVRVRPGLLQNGPTMCTSDWPTIQRIDIRPAAAGECPMEGKLLGNLSSSAGWTFRGEAELAGGKIAVPSGGGGASTRVSVPPDGNLAFTFTSATPSNVAVTIDGLQFTVGATTQTTTLCFPSWTYGGVHEVGFERFISGTEISAVSVASSASCGRDDFDAGFDGSMNQGSWMLFYQAATLDNGPDGRRSWRIQSAQSPIGAAVLIPGYGDDTVRPAISITNREASSAVEGLVTFNSVGLSNRSLVSSAFSAWAEDIICLGPEWAGQLATLIAVGQATSSSGTPTFWVDEIGPVTVDAELCP